MFEANDQISSICYDRPLEVELVIADDNVPGKPLHSVIVSEWDCSLRRKDLQVNQLHI